MKIFSKILLLAGISLACYGSSLNIVLDSKENIQKFSDFMALADWVKEKNINKIKPVNLNLKFCVDTSKCNRPKEISEVYFNDEIAPNGTIILVIDKVSNDEDGQYKTRGTYSFRDFHQSPDNSGFVNINENVLIYRTEEMEQCAYDNGNVSCEFEIIPATTNSTKSENSNACDPVKILNDFCNSDNTKKLIINEIKKDIPSDANIEIVSSKASSKLLEILETSEKNFGKAEITDEECQKAQTGGICDVFVTLKGVENGKNVSKDRQLEAIIIDGKVDTIRDKY